MAPKTKTPAKNSTSRVKNPPPAAADPGLDKALGRNQAQGKGKQTQNGVLSTVTPAGVAAALEAPPATQMRIDLDRIDPSPYQARQVFDEAELAELAASLTAHGQIQPIVVRVGGNARYELIAGERRCRAARLAGWQKIRAEVLVLTDAQAATLSLAENLRRSTLSPVEEARGLQALLQTGQTQEQLAAEFGITQSQISYRVRLLELPEDVQQKLMTREITATHARHLLPWVQYPAICKRVMDAWEPDMSHGDFQEEVLEAVRACSRPVKGGGWVAELGRYVDVAFKLTPEREKLLDLHEVVTRYGGREQRAFDVDAWDRLQAEALAAKAQREEKKAGKAGAADGEAPQVDRAEQKRREKQRAESLERRIRELVHRWKALVVLDWFGERAELRTLLAMLAAASAARIEVGAGHLETAYVDALPDAKHVRKRKAWDATPPTLLDLVTRSEAETRDVLRRYAALAIYDPTCNRPAPVDLLDALAAEAGIEWEAEWKAARMGGLTQPFFELHDKADLLRLCRAWKLTWSDAAKKGEIIAGLLGPDQAATKTLPETLRKALK